MLNKSILMGRICGDLELRRTQNNTPVTSFTIANDSGFGDKKQTSFIDIIAWNKTAEFVAQWFKKGNMIALSGRIQVRNYEDKQGNKRKAVEVVAEEVHFAEGKKEQGKAAEFSEIENCDSLPF